MASSSALGSSGTSALSKAGGAAASTGKSKASTPPSKNANPPAEKRSAAPAPPPSPPPASNTNSLSGSSLSGSTGTLNDNSSYGESERSYSYSRNSADGYSISSEGRSITTEGTTSLVNHLVNAFGSDEPGSASSQSCQTSSCDSSSDCGTYSEKRSEHFSARTEKQFDELDIARDQLTTAQDKVERVLDDAIEAKMNHQRPLPEKAVKKAEKDQERLIQAEGRLDRATAHVAEKQETRRQAQGQFELERRAAEDRLMQKFDGAGPELRREILKKFRPQINKDALSRNNPGQLEEAARWFVKSDSRAELLRREGCERARQEGEVCTTEEELNGNHQHQPLAPKAGKERQKLAMPKQKRRVEDRLRTKLRGTHFQEKLRDTSPAQRESLLENTLKPLAALSPKAASDLGKEVNSQWSRAEQFDNEVSNTDIAVGQDQIRRREAVDRLEERIQKNGSGSNSEPLKRAVDKLDSGFVRQTRDVLEHMDPGAVRCDLDLERTLGRSAAAVKEDLERAVARGGEPAARARSTVKQLNKAVQRTRVLGFQETRVSGFALTGPNLGHTYALTGGSRNSSSNFRPAPLINDL